MIINCLVAIATQHNQIVVRRSPSFGVRFNMGHFTDKVFLPEQIGCDIRDSCSVP